MIQIVRRQNQRKRGGVLQWKSLEYIGPGDKKSVSNRKIYLRHSFKKVVVRLESVLKTDGSGTINTRVNLKYCREISSIIIW